MKGTNVKLSYINGELTITSIFIDVQYKSRITIAHKGSDRVYTDLITLMCPKFTLIYICFQ